MALKALCSALKGACVAKTRIEERFGEDTYLYIHLISLTVAAISKTVKDTPGQAMLPLIGKISNFAESLKNDYEKDSFVTDIKLTIQKSAKELFIELISEFAIPALAFGIDCLQETVDKNHKELLRCFEQQAASVADVAVKMSSIGASLSGLCSTLDFDSERAMLIRDSALDPQMLEFLNGLCTSEELVELTPLNHFFLSQYGIKHNETARSAIARIREKKQERAAEIGPCTRPGGEYCPCAIFQGSGMHCTSCKHTHLNEEAV